MKAQLDRLDDSTRCQTSATADEARELTLDGQLVQKADPTQRLGGTSTHAAADCMSKRATWQRRWVLNVRFTDTVVVCGAVLLGHVRLGQTLSSAGNPTYYVDALSVLFMASWLIALTASHSRSPRLIGKGIEEYRRILTASFWTFGAMAIVSLVLGLEVGRGCLAIGLPSGVLGLLLSRMVWRQHVVRQRRRGRYQSTVLIFGEQDAAVHFAHELMCDAADGYQVVGLTIPGYGPPRGEGMVMSGRIVPILGDEDHVLRALSACDADTVAIAGTEHLGVKGIRRLIWDLEPKGVDLMVSTGVMDVALSRLVMRQTAGIPVLHIEKPQYKGAKKMQKRLFDIVFSCTAMLLAVPVLVIAAMAVKATSRGRVLYLSERIGIGGRPFFMFKFRTMVEDADKLADGLLEANGSDGLRFKLRNDPRVTTVGRLLRRLSIDELPQFGNVLLGQMSVVGPRPPLPQEVQTYDCDESRRLLVKPGITGLWQVSGRSDLTWDAAVRLDLSYVDNWSMSGDVLIVAKTVAAVLGRTGAY